MHSIDENGHAPEACPLQEKESCESKSGVAKFGSTISAANWEP